MGRLYCMKGFQADDDVVTIRSDFDPALGEGETLLRRFLVVFMVTWVVSQI